jgi:hypothetical protein
LLPSTGCLIAANFPASRCGVAHRFEYDLGLHVRGRITPLAYAEPAAQHRLALMASQWQADIRDMEQQIDLLGQILYPQKG